MNNASFAARDNYVKDVLADSIYDSNKNFRYLSRYNFRSDVKARSNSKVRSTNCHAGNICVIRQQANLKSWKAE